MSPSPRRPALRVSLRALAAALLLACGGCVSYLLPTDRDRSRSWRPFSEDRVGAVTLDDFLARRSALVIRSIISIRPQGGSFLIEESGLGTAAALTNDGYLLTAAHCVTEPNPHVIVVTREGRRITPARVVWAGDPEDERRDLAVLKVEQRLLWTFDWADLGEVREGTELVGAGYGGAAERPAPRVFGGLCVQAPEPVVGEGEPLTALVRGDLPFVPGDSGGPLVTRAGGLLAVNTRVTVSFFRPPRSISLAPDAAWVERTISEDRRKMGLRFASAR